MAIETLDSNQQVALQFKDTFPQELPQGYHLDNFLVLIQDISNRYHDLLSQEENSWIENFLELSQNAQSLLVRLIMRKGPFFRCDKLKYDDIKDLIATQKELADKQFIKINGSVPIESLLSLCLKAELASTYRYRFDSKTSQAKNQLVEELLNESREDSKSQEKIVALINQQFEWIERLHNDKIRRFLILFFGNSRQGLTEFVTSQLGIIQYETYSIEQENRFFQNRQRLDHLEQLAIIQDWQDDRLSIATIDEIQAQIDKLVSLLKASENIDHYVNHKIQRAITRITRQLERLDPEEALKAYHYSLAPPSRERQARILEKLGRYQEALDLVLAIESSPQHPDEAEKTIPLKTKLLKRLNQEIKPTNQLNINECYLRLSYQDPEKNIEQQVAEHFIKQGYPCLHTENQLFLGLFGLFFWDIIYMPCEDAFYNAYQLGPRDLWEQSFASKRENAIQARLMELKAPKKGWQQRLLNTVKTKQGLANYFVNWQRFDSELTELLCDHIPAEHLDAVFSQILQNPGYYRNGFPDLLLLKDKGYELWEVKGPTDSLQTNQKRWLSFFENHNIPAGVIHVSWGDNE